MHEQEPALDQARWENLWARLGATGSGLAEFENLQAAYAEPHRFYHTTSHIQDCLFQFDRSRDLAGHPDTVEAAIWYHDAVYLPGAADNEERSARAAESALSGGAVSPELARRVAQLVLATDHRAVPRGPDARLLCDIDLSILGRETEVYDEFERSIRREYAMVPDAIFRRGRAALLESFLARPSIYTTDRFRAEYEHRARANLAGSLSRLTRA